MSKRKRSRLWIDPGFQLKLLSRAAVYFVVFTLMTFHFAFALDTIIAIANNGIEQNFLEYYARFFYQQRAMLLTCVLVSPILLYDLLKFSNRVAGPLARCRKLMREMTTGKTVAEFAPRKNDLMPEFFKAFSDLVQVWNRRIAPTAPLEEKHATVVLPELHATSPN